MKIIDKNRLYTRCIPWYDWDIEMPENEEFFIAIDSAGEVAVCFLIDDIITVHDSHIRGEFDKGNVTGWIYI